MLLATRIDSSSAGLIVRVVVNTPLVWLGRVAPLEVLVTLADDVDVLLERVGVEVVVVVDEDEEVLVVEVKVVEVDVVGGMEVEVEFVTVV